MELFKKAKENGTFIYESGNWARYYYDGNVISIAIVDGCSDCIFGSLKQLSSMLVMKLSNMVQENRKDIIDETLSQILRVTFLFEGTKNPLEIYDGELFFHNETVARELFKKVGLDFDKEFKFFESKKNEHHTFTEFIRESYPQFNMNMYIGDEVDVCFYDREIDEDLVEALENHKGKFIIESVDYESNSAWLEEIGCRVDFTSLVKTNSKTLSLEKVEKIFEEGNEHSKQLGRLVLLLIDFKNKNARSPYLVCGPLNRPEFKEYFRIEFQKDKERFAHLPKRYLMT